MPGPGAVTAARCPRCQVYVAAFAVSAYASTYYRAGSKPFNPVLGETYECVRPDRGFRFISEQVGTGGKPGGDTRALDGALECPFLSPQVSHHPPISACHAESDNFVFWQGECPGGRWAPGGSSQGRGTGGSHLLLLLLCPQT